MKAIRPQDVHLQPPLIFSSCCNSVVVSLLGFTSRTHWQGTHSATLLTLPKTAAEASPTTVDLADRRAKLCVLLQRQWLRIAVQPHPSRPSCPVVFLVPRARSTLKIHSATVSDRLMLDHNTSTWVLSCLILFRYYHRCLRGCGRWPRLTLSG